MKIIVDVNLAVRWANIEQGTIITIDPYKTRMHILPFLLPEK